MKNSGNLNPGIFVEGHIGLISRETKVDGGSAARLKLGLEKGIDLEEKGQDTTHEDHNYHCLLEQYEEKI